MFAATLGRLEFQFRRVRIHGHTLTLGIRETLRLELRQRERLGTRPEVLATVRTNQSLSQPSSQHHGPPGAMSKFFTVSRRTLALPKSAQCYIT
jgi:hypothetical protein